MNKTKYKVGDKVIAICSITHSTIIPALSWGVVQRSDLSNPVVKFACLKEPVWVKHDEIMILNGDTNEEAVPDLRSEHEERGT